MIIGSTDDSRRNLAGTDCPRMQFVHETPWNRPFGARRNRDWIWMFQTEECRLDESRAWRGFDGSMREGSSQLRRNPLCVYGFPLRIRYPHPI